MRLEELSITNYKNIDSKNFLFKEDIVCMVGDNGVGKSNILSSIYHLCFGKCFINSSSISNIKFGSKFYMIQGIFSKNNAQENLNFSYKKGETPIPCIRCNQTVKFIDLINFAKSLNCKYLATGHYIKRVEDKNGIHLFCAEDDKKDQSYFLFATTQQQLKILRFPLGNFKKSEIREIAKFYELGVEDKKDSQDICFIPNGDYKKFFL